MSTEPRNPATPISNLVALRRARTDERRPLVRAGSSRAERTVALRVGRTVGAIALLVTGGVHLEQYTVAHFSVIPTIGPLFLVNFIAATMLGLVLLVPLRATSGRRRLTFEALASLAGIGLAAGALAALLISEQTPVFGFMEQGYRLAIVIAITAEAVAIISLGDVLLCVRERVRGCTATVRSGEARHNSAPTAAESQ